MNISRPDIARSEEAPPGAVCPDYQIEFDRTQRASLGGAGIAVVGGATPAGAQTSQPRPVSATSASAGR